MLGGTKIDNNGKTALVLSSGAMMGSYQCGVLKAFRQHNLEFDVLIGSSAGAYNGIRYLSDQMDICERIYVDDLTNGRFFNKKNLFIPGKNFMDLNYLVDEVCKMESRVIDMDKVIKSKSEFYITAFELDTMTTRFFDAKKYDIFLLLKATAAIPYVYKDEVIIEGKRYIDGGMFEPIPIKKAIELKCNKIYVVLNTTLEQANKRKKSFLHKLPGRIPKIMAEHNRIKHELNNFLYQKHEGIEIIVIRPKEPIPANRFTADKDKIQACVDIGYRDGLDFIAKQYVG